MIVRNPPVVMRTPPDGIPSLSAWTRKKTLHCALPFVEMSGLMPVGRSLSATGLVDKETACDMAP